MLKTILIMCVAIASVVMSGVYLMAKSADTIHHSVMRRDHTHYTSLDIDFKKETCIEYYDGGSWFPVYVCSAH